MATHTDTWKDKTRPPWLRRMYAVLATVAALACAFVVIGKFTWGSELYDGDSYWVSADAAFWAGLGVIGFTGLAVRMWLPAREEEPTWHKWMGPVFWTYFAIGMVAMVIWHAGRAGDEDTGLGWPIVALLGFFAVLTIWGAIESTMKAWRETHTHSGRGAAAH